MVACQIVLNATVTLVRVSNMDLLHNLGYLLVFQFSAAFLPTEPAIIGCSGYTKYIARCFYRISVFFFAFLNCPVDMGLPYLAQPRLLSISSNFFSR